MSSTWEDAPDENHYRIEKPENKELFILCVLLNQYFARISLQEERILESLKNPGTKYLATLFSDIHFYFNTVSGIDKILLKIRKISTRDEEFVRIYKKYVKQLKNIDDIRDHLEHITDNRLEGKDKKGIPLKEPGMLGNLIGDVYNFCGDTVNIKDMFVLMKELNLELSVWNRYPYPN